MGKIVFACCGIIGLIVLAACATLSEDQCRSGNWYEIGLADGANGYDQKQLDRHAKACTDYGIAPDHEDWERGRQDGLPTYCRPRRVYEEGRKGRTMRNVCPIEDQAELRRANRRGLTYARINTEIRSLTSEIARINSAMSGLPAGSPERAALISERASLRLEILVLRTERNLYASP